MLMFLLVGFKDMVCCFEWINVIIGLVSLLIDVFFLKENNVKRYLV